MTKSFKLPATPQPRKSSSPLALRLLTRAQRELRGGQGGNARRTLADALLHMPGDTNMLRRAGVIAQAAGDLGQAVQFFRRSVIISPRDYTSHINLGVAEFRSGNRRSGIAHLRLASELAPTSASAWFTLGEALKQDAQMTDATSALGKALRLQPGHIAARLFLARALASIGEIDACVNEFREVLRRTPHNARAWFGLSNLNSVPFVAADVNAIRSSLAEAPDGTEEQAMAAFALAKAIEDQKDYAGAWDAFREANSIQRKRVKWDSAGEHRRVLAIERMCSSWNPPQPLDATLGNEVIMVTSIPRSGTSLVEQILASHPDVEGANEISASVDVINEESRRRRTAFPLWIRNMTAGDWRRLGSEYLVRTSRWHTNKPRFTDKNLATWYTAAAVAAMLPAAKIVIVRRNPLEACLACYRQWFSVQSGFTYDLGEMTTYCADFQRLSRLWLRKFPGRVFDLEYETLVAQPELTIRELLTFCGLSYAPACLQFHRTKRTVLSAPSAAQVRRPLQRNTARARLYGGALDALRKQLRAASLTV